MSKNVMSVAKGVAAGMAAGAIVATIGKAMYDNRRNLSKGSAKAARAVGDQRFFAPAVMRAEDSVKQLHRDAQKECKTAADNEGRECSEGNGYPVQNYANMRDAEKKTHCESGQKEQKSL